VCKITIHLPNIHCSSCIGLLENISKIIPEIINSNINFLVKKANITFNKKQLSLKNLAEFLDKIDYPPDFTWEESPSKTKKTQSFNSENCHSRILLWKFNVDQLA